MICPNCGTNLDDNAAECFLCGCHINTEQNAYAENPNECANTCPTCGSEIGEQDTICPVCGTPIESLLPIENTEEDYKAEDDSGNEKLEPQNQSNKNLIIIAVSVIALVIIGILVFLLLCGNKSDDESSVIPTEITTTTTTTMTTTTESTTETSTTTTTTTSITTTSTNTTTSTTTVTTTTEPETDGFDLYTIQVYNPCLPIYDAPSYDANIVGEITDMEEYTIVEEFIEEGQTSIADTWGKLKSGVGWINLFDASIAYSNDDTQEDPVSVEPYAETETTTVDGVEFEYITYYSDNDIVVNINSVIITHTQEMAYYDEYEIKIEAEITDKLTREKYLGCYMYDSEGYKLDEVALAKVDGSIKESYKFTVWDKNTAKIFIDIFA